MLAKVIIRNYIFSTNDVIQEKNYRKQKKSAGVSAQVHAFQTI